MGIKEFEDYTFTQPFSRLAWNFINYLIAHSCKGLDEKNKWYHGVGFVGNSKDHVITWSVVFKSERSAYDLLYKIMEDLSLLEDLKKYSISSKNELLEYLNSKQLEKLSNEELKEVFKYSFKKLSHITRVAIVLRALDYVIVPYLRKVLTKKDVRDINEAIAILSYTEKEIFVFEEEKAVLQLAKKLQDGELSIEDKKFSEEINNIWQKYRSTTMGTYKEKPRSKEDYIQTVKNLSKDANDSLRQIEEKYKKNIRKRHKLIQQLNLTPEEKPIAEITSEIPYLKDLYRECWNVGIYSTSPLFYELSKRINRPENHVKNYWLEEIEKALDGTPVNDDIINQRIKHNTILGLPGLIRIYEGKEAELFEKKYLTTDSEQKKEFKGRTACKGKASGKVKVVRGSEDFHKVQEGDILVVGNTTPDYVVILKKVAAIVAEEGGITAHVSVISREFNIPAIVGVANATIQLKDNDKVEVDADHGIVKILERKK